MWLRAIQLVLGLFGCVPRKGDEVESLEQPVTEMSDAELLTIIQAGEKFFGRQALRSKRNQLGGNCNGLGLA